jgi:hypothetical protein
MNKSRVNQSQETKEPLSFLSSNHRVKPSGLCQLRQVAALQQQRVKERVRERTKTKPKAHAQIPSERPLFHIAVAWET